MLKDYMDKKSEILEALHDTAMELLLTEETGKSRLIEYTKHDVIAASLVFMHILSNIAAHRYSRNGVFDLAAVELEMKEFHTDIKEIVNEMTGVDLDKKNG